MTNLKNELSENGYDLTRAYDAEVVIDDLILPRPPEEIAARIADLVQMLRPEHAPNIFNEFNLNIMNRLNAKHPVMIASYDALLSGLAPWLLQQGYPDLRPKP